MARPPAAEPASERRQDTGQVQAVSRTQWSSRRAQELEHDEAATRLDDASHLGESKIGLRQGAEAKSDGGGVEGVPREGKRERVSLDPFQVGPPAWSLFQHPGAEIQPYDP